MDKKYWDNYYTAGEAVHYPSPFAEFCLEKYLKPSMKIIELGCGTGRDAFYFSENGISIIGIDQSEIAIKQNKLLMNEFDSSDSLEFVVDDFTNDLEKYSDIVGVYSRFTLHSVSKDDQDNITEQVYNSLLENGLFLIECRTNKDPLIHQGQKIGPGERFTDHYRRFINANEFLRFLLNLGFNLEYFIESDNLASFHSENPIVARYILRK